MSKQSPKKSAFTLVEMVTSMAIIGILILVIGTALSFSIKTTAGQGAVNQTNLLAAGDAADQMADDMHVALSFSEAHRHKHRLHRSRSRQQRHP